MQSLNSKLYIVQTMNRHIQVKPAPANEWQPLGKLPDKVKVIPESPEVSNDDISGLVCKTKLHEFVSSDWSVAGLKYVVLNGASIPRRILWLVLVLFGTGFMIYQVYDR